jgi:hypothetical protein
MIDLLYNVLFPLCAVMAWSACLYKLRDLRRDWRNPTLRALCAAIAFPALAFTLAPPWVYLRVDRVLEVANLATLGIYGCVVVHSATAQILLLLWTYPSEQVWRRARWRLLVCGLALATMITLFLLASVPEERPTDFDARYAGTPPIGAFLLVYFTAFAVGLAGIARLCWRYGRVAGRLWLRRGLRITAVGAGFALGYCGCKLVYVVGRLLGEDLPAWNLAAPVCAAIGAPLLCVGLTIPGWGPRLSALRGGIDRYRSYRELRPLWLALCQATPEIALVPPTSAATDTLAFSDVDFRLYRRVIEIRDGWLALRPYFAPGVAATARQLAEAAGLAGNQLQVAVEAASLAAALHAKVDAEDKMGTTTRSEGGGEHGGHPGGADLSSEIAWLVQVARAIDRSPVVAATLAATSGGDKPSSGIMRMTRNANLLRIQRLDPERDYHQIYRTLALVEFPWDMRMALQLAFLRTFAVPSISGLLDRAGQITHRTHKRALDTALLMFELIDHGFAHPRGRDAVRRLNRIHQQYDIANHDYLYVLGTLVLVPTRWLERYGWRPICCHERTATYVFYRELGRRMGIRDIPPSYEAFEVFFDVFERERFRRTEAGQRLMRANRSLLVARFSGPLAPLAGGLADALLDEPFRRAVGVDPAPWPIRAALLVGLKTRARVLRLLPPQPGRAPTDGIRYGIKTSAVYPEGYEISQLGPR